MAEKSAALIAHDGRLMGSAERPLRAISGHSITDKLFGTSLSVDDWIAFVTLLVVTT